MADIPTTEPSSIRAGDTWQWRREDLSDYPASTWTLKYYIKNASYSIIITAAADSNNFAVAASAETTAAHAPGTYTWVAYVEKGAGATLERHEVDSGTIEILASFASTTAYDNRSHIKKVLDAIEAAVEGRASRTDLSYSIQGRSIQHMPPTELIKWHSHYKRLYKQEQDAEKIKNGLGTGNKILTRFV